MFSFKTTLRVAVMPLLVASSVLTTATHPVDAKPRQQADVRIESITVGPPETGSTHRDIIVVVRNEGNASVGAFDLSMVATRDGFTRPASVQPVTGLKRNQSKVIVFPDLGCKWLNPVNDAVVTVSTDPAPVPGETGRKKNNYKRIEPNIDWSLYPECV